MIDSISIVIPSYNESQNINEIYRRIIEVIKKLSVKKFLSKMVQKTIVLNYLKKLILKINL